MGFHGMTDYDVEHCQKVQGVHHGMNFCFGKGCYRMLGEVHGIEGEVHGIEGEVHWIEVVVQVDKEGYWWDTLGSQNLAIQHKYMRKIAMSKFGSLKFPFSKPFQHLVLLSIRCSN